MNISTITASEGESKVSAEVSGVDPGQRQLNGPQTTGRSYRNLSEPLYEVVTDEDRAVPMRDGARLMADVHRPRRSMELRRSRISVQKSQESQY